ncbi:MAG: ATPase domain-containing protein [Candidatus Jordarchaeaceae archaeon]
MKESVVDVASSIPQEIAGALESGYFSLHIKGGAGTGKTTAALEIARLFPEDSQAVYVSTRVSPDKLYKKFPWSKSCIHQENILDTGTSLFDRGEENILRYVDKLSLLKNLYYIVSSKTKHSTIIMDNLEALKSSLNTPKNDFSMERNIIEICERMNAGIIFISESSDDSELDYFVDGVVRLEKEIVNNRLVRKIYIEKTQGRKIENPVYLFTLKDGRFTCFEKGVPINVTTPELPKAEKDKGGKVSTSIPELDDILGGGFERGTFNVFEVGEKVGVAHFYLMIPMFLGFIFQGYPVFTIPSKGLNVSDIPKNVLSSISTDDTLKKLRKYFYLFRPLRTNIRSRDTTRNEYYIRGINFNEDLNSFRELAVNVLDGVKADTLFVEMATDTMEYIYGSRDLPKIIQAWVGEVKQLKGIMILFQFEHESNKLPIHLASSYFKIENIDGNIVVYGEIPKTKMYVATLDLTGMIPYTRLVPIE